MENAPHNVIIPHTNNTCVCMIFKNNILCILAALTLINLGCSREIPANPMCRTHDLSTHSAPSPAACLIKSNGKLLALKIYDDKGWSLPSLKQQKTTSAQCTAHLAVWKSTGLNVEVGDLLFTSENQTQYYACSLTDEYSSQLDTFPVPPWANRKTKHISLIDPFDTRQDQWEVEIDLIQVREAYTQL